MYPYCHISYVSNCQLHPADLPLFGNCGLCPKSCSCSSDRTAGDQKSWPKLDQLCVFIWHRLTSPSWSLSFKQAFTLVDGPIFFFSSQLGWLGHPGHLPSDKLLHLPWRNQGCHMDQCLSGDSVMIGHEIIDLDKCNLLFPLIFDLKGFFYAGFLSLLGCNYSIDFFFQMHHSI